MTNPKDQLSMYYEQQRKLIDQIKDMRKEFTEEQKLTTRYRKQRDRFKAERQTLIEKTIPDVEDRNSQKEMIEGLKKRRDFLKRQTQRTERAPFKILSNQELKDHLWYIDLLKKKTS